jgi:hypothetical protein
MPAYVNCYSPRFESETFGTLVLDDEGFQPVLSLSESYANRVGLEHVPLINGDVVTFTRKDVLRLNLSGTMNYTNKSSIPTQQELLIKFMIGIKGEDPEPFTFYRFHHADYRRWWGPCYCESLQFNHNSRSVRTLDYDISLVIPNGREFISGAIPLKSNEVGGTHDDPLIHYEYRYGPRVIELGDSAGESYVVFNDDTSTPVMKVDSEGNVEYVNEVYQTGEITL